MGMVFCVFSSPLLSTVITDFAAVDSAFVEGGEIHDFDHFGRQLK
jgi:hypothetical protein